MNSTCQLTVRNSLLESNRKEYLPKILELIANKIFISSKCRMRLPKNFDYKFLGVISIGFIIFGYMFGFVFFPRFLHHMIAGVSKFLFEFGLMLDIPSRGGIFLKTPNRNSQFSKRSRNSSELIYFDWNSPQKSKNLMGRLIRINRSFSSNLSFFPFYSKANECGTWFKSSTLLWESAFLRRFPSLRVQCHK